MAKPSQPKSAVSSSARRSFLCSGAAGTVSIGMLNPATAQPRAKALPANKAAATAAAAGAGEASALHTVQLNVNGQRRTLAVESRTTLVEALRDQLGMTGTKIGCNHGQCGACTVLLDGRRLNACLVLAVAVQGAKVVTIEGLASPDGTPHPMQRAFAEKDALQCGYCTPGQILSAVACIEEGHAGSADEIREYMSGNLCRCAAYPNIVAAVEAVRDGSKA